MKLLAGILIALYLLLPMVIFHRMDDMSGMNMATQQCILVVGEVSLCPMDFLAHITIWQQMTHITIATIVLIAFAMLFFVWHVSTQLLHIRDRLYIKERRWEFFERLYITLFIKGILNPKTY